jgi:hypothetical protein
MAHTPLHMSISEVQTEVHPAWTEAYSPAATVQALDAIADEPVPYKISHLVARIIFRGIYFPPRTAWGWLKVIASNRAPIWRVFRESFTQWHGTRSEVGRQVAAAAAEAPAESGSD